MRKDSTALTLLGEALNALACFGLVYVVCHDVTLWEVLTWLNVQ